MSATRISPAPRRANTDAVASTTIFGKPATPRHAFAAPVAHRSGRAVKATVGLATGAALIGGLLVGTSQQAAASELSNAPRLKIGADGSSVLRLQKELNARTSHDLPTTGYFGTQTKKRVNTLKRKHHLKRDGVAGYRVWKILLNDKHHISSPALTSHSKTSYRKPAVKAAYASSKAARAVAYAKAHLGDPYVYGAAGPNAFDCSGLTMRAWQAAGVKLPHNTNAQYAAAKHISKSQLRPGDLVFFYSGMSHVGLYVGNGKVIHAPRPGTPVQYIKMSYMPYAGAARPA